jgi:YVTN family beta-propeller protein
VRDVLKLEDARFPHHIYLSPDQTLFTLSITDTDLSGGHVHGSVPGKDYQVLVFESATGKLRERIHTEGMAHNAVFSPDGTELWVGEAGDSESHIRIFDTKRFKEQSSITVGGGLSEVTFSADGSRAYACNTSDNTVSIVDPSTKQVLRTLTVGSIPVGAWPAANGRMYLDSEGAYSVTEIDVAGDSIISVFSVGSKPGYVAYHPGRDEVWVSDATNGSVRIFAPVAGEWVYQDSIGTGADAHAIGFSADGATAWVTNQGASTVSLLDVGQRVKLLDIPTGSMPNGIAFYRP